MGDLETFSKLSLRESGARSGISQGGSQRSVFGRKNRFLHGSYDGSEPECFQNRYRYGLLEDPVTGTRAKHAPAHTSVKNLFHVEKRLGRGVLFVSPIKAHNLHQIGARARPVEFAELDALPGAEDQFAAVDQQRDAVADQRGFDVAVAVAFGVLVIGFLLGDQRFQFFQQVVFDVGIGVFVDGDGGGRVRCSFVISSEVGR